MRKTLVCSNARDRGMQRGLLIVAVGREAGRCYTHEENTLCTLQHLRKLLVVDLPFFAIEMQLKHSFFSALIVFAFLA